MILILTYMQFASQSSLSTLSSSSLSPPSSSSLVPSSRSFLENSFVQLHNYNHIAVVVLVTTTTAAVVLVDAAIVVYAEEKFVSKRNLHRIGSTYSASADLFSSK